MSETKHNAKQYMAARAFLAAANADVVPVSAYELADFIAERDAKDAEVFMKNEQQWQEVCADLRREIARLSAIAVPEAWIHYECGKCCSRLKSFPSDGEEAECAKCGEAAGWFPVAAGRQS